MASKVDIWNTALSNIGHRAVIADPDERSAEANHCRRFYPIALGATLERFAWDFATRRAALAQVANPYNDWRFAYAMPNKCIAAREVMLPESATPAPPQPFAIESDDNGTLVLYTDVENAVLKYTTLVEDTTKFSQFFVIALSFELASMLVGPIPKDDNKKMAMAKQAIYWTSVAEASNANNSKNDAYRDFTPGHLAAR